MARTKFTHKKKERAMSISTTIRMISSPSSTSYEVNGAASSRSIRSNVNTEHSYMNDEEVNEEADDGYPWFGCICGKTHESFWIQCEGCNAWFNCSPGCIGFDEYEIERRGVKNWQCPICLRSTCTTAMEGNRRISCSSRIAKNEGSSSATRNTTRTACATTRNETCTLCEVVSNSPSIRRRKRVRNKDGRDHDDINNERITKQSKTQSQTSPSPLLLLDQEPQPNVPVAKATATTNKNTNNDDLLHQHSIYSEDIESLNNSILCEPLQILTERSTTICSRLITHFLLNEDRRTNKKKEDDHHHSLHHVDSCSLDFDSDLWTYIWTCLRYEQKSCGWEKGWNSYTAIQRVQISSSSSSNSNSKRQRSDSSNNVSNESSTDEDEVEETATHRNTSSTCYYYPPKTSPCSNGIEGIDYFTSKEGVVAYLCQIISQIDKNAFDCLSEDVLQKFIGRLMYANDSTSQPRLTYNQVKQYIPYEDVMMLLKKKKNRRMKNENDGNDQHESWRKEEGDEKINMVEVENSSNDVESTATSSSAETGHYKVSYTSGSNTPPQEPKVDDTEIIRLNQELLDAVATGNVQKYSSLCTDDTITYNQKSNGLQRGIPTTESQFTSKNEEDSTRNNTMGIDGKHIKQCPDDDDDEDRNGEEEGRNLYTQIFMKNQYLEWQGENNDVAVLSYVRHNISKHFHVTREKEVRIWTRKDGGWKNTVTFNHSI